MNGKAVVVADIPEKTRKTDLPEGVSIINNIKVFQPAPKTAQATYIRVVYNGRSDPDAAYNFTNAKDQTDYGTRYVPEPFKTSLT